ncbi:RNA-binding S4 domain-containing protein [Gaetbulibacter sp. M240]|uniref:RNA-binding S4 domain-containing protein n=1 Tax=Gaetbulibacter sp. M240 TaxID=3126511 RepID=UPI00374F8509
MRIDKFLWCVRYYKTRSLATTACKKGHVKLNSDTVKPSREVYPQDIIEVRKSQINYKLVVNDIPENRVGAKLVDIYLTDKTPKEQFDAQEMLKYSKDYYRKKGTGRPTKKDRRDIDEYKNDPLEPDL